MEKVAVEFEKFRELNKNELSEAEKHFIGYMEQAAKKVRKNKNDE